MTTALVRDVVYRHDGDDLHGLLLSSQPATAAPTVLLVHDAFGLGGFSLEMAHRYARLGYVVFAADMWGGRRQPGEHEIGPLIGAMIADRARWVDRIAAAHATAAAQPEVDADRIAAIGYCFGGSTVLEHVRVGGAVKAAIGIHAGLDLLDPAAPWMPAAEAPRVLVCIGADDPMATADQRETLQRSMTDAGVAWEVDLYSHTVHAFTNPRLDPSPRPEVVAYQPRSAARAWDATVRLLGEALPPQTPA